MAALRIFVAAVSACLAALAVEAPAAALPDEPAAEVDSAARAREQATNQALLAALRERRAELARLPNAQDNRYAFEFLDRQIDRVTNQMLLDALRQRRDEIARMPDAEHRRFALDFLDRQIESVRRDLDNRRRTAFGRLREERR